MDAAYFQSIRERCRAIEARFAPLNNVNVSVGSAFGLRGDGACNAYGYLQPLYNNHFGVHGDTIDEALDKFEAALAERMVEFRSKSVRQLALKVIELTADFGSCTIAQLRDTSFTDAQLADMRADVEAEANRLATSGQPFVIVDAVVGNGAPEGDEGDE